MDGSDIRRNLYMLKGPLAKKGYDWWWHNFTGYKRSNGEPKSFFIEYFICNPSLGKDEPILGQAKYNLSDNRKPSYALIKVGYWGKEAKQIHNFYSINNFNYDNKKLDIKIGECLLTEKMIKGTCSLSMEDALQHPEYMSGWGTMVWDLKVDKQIAFNVGYGASPFIRSLNAFEMFWHAEGIKTQFSGEVILNNEVYDIIPERSHGYSDKNWGSDFTSPWLWISSCNIKSLLTGKTLQNSAIEMGGGNPKIYGFSLGRKLLGCMYYEGDLYEYNFSKFWTGSKVNFTFTESNKLNTWLIEANNQISRVELSLECKKNEMLLINYESPDGKKRHNRLWNGGTGVGEIKLFKREKQELELVDHMSINNVGCEYGEYD
jgi:tocopherol cyclase